MSVKNVRDVGRPGENYQSIKLDKWMFCNSYQESSFQVPFVPEEWVTTSGEFF